ncbi:hypothetical protein SAMD00019534_040260 [Acytostelium subglobosum LB1]|uniref:hypothetical protein n=1 Tax=Acytostelium subglobosum LB1 TaxID=1410327 RepID=UPI000644960C|nr:hypothetical protein SAMD00019534_040260 [Acytostelium subglobosum LB1]GAM20851.1 hypothetical protein SAMD00019534_040260 [Acytostelium subglobosum LB1]|eukprot:XP_012755985.1 hypothetical protein SAMD00019534_040260 [Acytostelium subglobosum LB1]
MSLPFTPKKKVELEDVVSQLQTQNKMLEHIVQQQQKQQAQIDQILKQQQQLLNLTLTEHSSPDSAALANKWPKPLPNAPGPGAVPRPLLLEGAGGDNPLPMDKVKVIVTMDGGGFRGLISIQMLQYFEDMLGVNISEVGDLFGGTSTGGILMLGKLNKLSNKDLEIIYKELGTKVLPVSCKNIRNGSLANSKLMHGELSKRFPSSPIRTFLPERRAFVSVCAKKHGLSEPYLPYVLSNYVNETRKLAKGRSVMSTSGNSFENISVVDALRATSAVPLLFESPKVGDYTFVDGGFKNNNPTMNAIDEAHDLWGQETHLIIISIGTGRYNSKTIPIEKPKSKKNAMMKKIDTVTEQITSSIFEQTSVLKTLLDVTNSHQLHKEIKSDLAKHHSANVSYYRFDPVLSKEISLKDCSDKVISQMRLDTLEFINSAKFQTKFHSLRKELQYINKL